MMQYIWVILFWSCIQNRVALSSWFYHDLRYTFAYNMPIILPLGYRFTHNSSKECSNSKLSENLHAWYLPSLHLSVSMIRLNKKSRVWHKANKNNKITRALTIPGSSEYNMQFIGSDLLAEPASGIPQFLEITDCIFKTVFQIWNLMFTLYIATDRNHNHLIWCWTSLHFSSYLTIKRREKIVKRLLLSIRKCAYNTT